MAITVKNIKTDPKDYIDRYIAPIAVTRLKQDIARWRSAIREAESVSSPQRFLMQQMYLDTVLNGHVYACMERRALNVLKKGLVIVDEKGNENEAMTKIYGQAFMSDISRLILEAQLYGYSLIQLGDMENYKFDEVYHVRRSNINPECEVVTQNFYSMDGISIYDEKYYPNLIWVKTTNTVGRVAGVGKCGYGLLYTVAPYEMWYKQAMTLWNEYQQLFGIPIRIGKTNTRDEQMRNQMGEMLANMGAAAWGVFDTEDKIELLNNHSIPNGNEVFESMINKVEKIISKIILGHADAIDSIPGKLGASQGDTSPAMLAMRDIESSDIKFLENEFDTNVVPKLEALGFPKLGKMKLRVSNNSEKAEKRVKEDANNKVTADIVKVLADAGYKADAAYIAERTGIPIKEAAKVEPTKNIQRMEAISNKLKGLYAEGCNHE